MRYRSGTPVRSQLPVFLGAQPLVQLLQASGNRVALVADRKEQAQDVEREPQLTQVLRAEQLLLGINGCGVRARGGHGGHCPG
jgi:hypothetical protein